MKITIEPSPEENFEKLEWDNVYQVAMTANFMAEKMVRSKTCFNMICDKAELIGQLHEQIERVRNHVDSAG